MNTNISVEKCVSIILEDLRASLHVSQVDLAHWEAELQYAIKGCPAKFPNTAAIDRCVERVEHFRDRVQAFNFAIVQFLKMQ